MERYIHVNGKNLRLGYTTGTCACGAASYATEVLLAGERRAPHIVVDTPAGIPVSLDIHNIVMDDGFVSCSVQKDGGDDPDVTSRMHIYVKAEKIPDCETSVLIEGGEGIGIVTKPGLDQPVGNAAINSTPRRYITEIVESIKKKYGCKESIKITISAPEGIALAQKTFNPRMGIEGGISIIGTTGIVEPMSNDAIVQTTKIEIGQHREKGETTLYLAPGKIGENFATAVLGIDSEEIVLCSNNIGEAVENAILAGFQEIILIGHVGKLVKLGYGAKNTHSANGDGRMEEIIFCAVQAGADAAVLKEIAECVTTDGAIALLEEANLLAETMCILGERIESTLQRWCEGKARIRLCVFTNKSNEAKILIRRGL